MVVKRTFAQKQAEARAIVSAREVTRISKGITTELEREKARQTGVSPLERAKSELAAAQAIAAPTPPRVPVIPPTPEISPRVIQPRPRIRVTEMMRSVGDVVTEPLRVTKAEPPPLPPMEVLPRREEIFGEIKPFEPFTIKERARYELAKIRIREPVPKAELAEEIYAAGITGKFGYPIYKGLQQVLAIPRVKTRKRIDPFLMIAAGLAPAGIKVGARWAIARLPTRTQTIAAAKEVARIGEKSIFDIEAYTRVKPFLRKPKIIKVKGIAEIKPFKELVYTRAELKAITAKEEVPIFVKGIAKVKDRIALGIDITKIKKDIFVQPTVSIKVAEKGAREFWKTMGETIGRRVRATDIGIIGVKPIAPSEIDVTGGFGLILKQIPKVAKPIVKPKVVAKPFEYLLPPILRPEIKPPKPVPITKVKVKPIPVVKPVPIYEPAFYQREELEMLPAFAEAPRLTQKQLQRQRQIELQVQRTMQVQQQKQLQKLVQLPKVAPKLTERQIARQALIPALGLGLIQEPKFALKPITPIFPTPRKVPIKPRILPPVILPPFIPRIRETKAERKRRKRAEAIARKQQLAYAASVGAVQLGITAPRVPTGILTGLELRPVIRKKKGKKKKKRKPSQDNYLKNLNRILR